MSRVLPSARNGQSTIELAVMLSVVAAALVGMNLYLRRAYQGYLRGSASAQGQQFDPTQPYATTQRLNQFSQTQDVQIDTVDTGGHAIKTTVNVVTDWDISRDARHEAR